MYWKKLTSVAERNVIEPLARVSYIGHRIEAGEGLKIVNEMCLVIITTGQSDIDPVDSPTFPDEAQHALEAADAAELFGRQPDFVTKNLYEPPLTDSDLPHHLSDLARMRNTLECAQPESDGGVP